MLARVGHNSAPYGQMLKPVIPAAPKGPKQRFPFFKFYPRDWLEATRNMTLEARGAYIDLICILMELEGHLADDDKWISYQMHVSPRKWRALKFDLVKHEKISLQDGCIVNERCLKELDALMAQRQNLSGSAVKRERAKRETLVKHPGNNDENSEKLNENNGCDTTAVPLRARVLDTDIDLDKEERPKGLLSSGQLALAPSDEPLTASRAAREAFALYNETAQRCGIPVARTFDKARAKALAMRVKEAGGMDGFRMALSNLEKSPFLCGKNDTGWRANLNFVCQPSSFLKLLEGSYGDGKLKTEYGRNGYAGGGL